MDSTVSNPKGFSPKSKSRLILDDLPELASLAQTSAVMGSTVPQLRALIADGLKSSSSPSSIKRADLLSRWLIDLIMSNGNNLDLTDLSVLDRQFVERAMQDHLLTQSIVLGLPGSGSPEGYQLIDLRADRRCKIFVFHARPTRRDDVLAFYVDGAAVGPLSVSSTIKEIKAPLHYA